MIPSPTPNQVKDLLTLYVSAGLKQTDLMTHLKEKGESLHSISGQTYWDLKYKIEKIIKSKRDAKKNKY